MKPSIDWQYIRLRYESGESAYKIAGAMGDRPTKQGIAKRAKREAWIRGNGNALTIASTLPIVKQAQALTGPSKCTAERVAFILDLISRGSTERLASSAAGIDVKTLKRWVKADAQLGEQIRQARAGKLAEWVSHIDRAASSDWKAARELLTTSSDASDWQPQATAGITIVLNIDRDAPQPSVVSEQ